MKVMFVDGELNPKVKKEFVDISQSASTLKILFGDKSCFVTALEKEESDLQQAYFFKHPFVEEMSHWESFLDSYVTDSIASVHPKFREEILSTEGLTAERVDTLIDLLLSRIFRAVRRLEASGISEVSFECLGAGPHADEFEMEQGVLNPFAVYGLRGLQDGILELVKTHKTLVKRQKRPYNAPIKKKTAHKNLQPL